MSSLKQLIINAIIKVSATDPALDREGGPTAEEARDAFIADLMAELFPEHGNEAAVVKSPGAPKLTREEKEAAKAAKEAAKAAKEAAKAAKAAASPKKSPEDKAAAKAAKEAEKEAAKAAKEAAKAVKPAASPKKSPEDKAAAKAAKEAEKAAEKAAKEAAKGEEKAAKEAAKAAAKAAKVPLPASPKPAGNLAKLDPTWRKALKEADKDHAKELEPALLAYLNEMSNAGYQSHTAKEHVAQFLASRPAAAAPAPAAAPIDLEVVEFPSVPYETAPGSGVFSSTYYVDPETKRVYAGVTDAKGELTITRPVGYVGMADFKDMTLDDA
jgi:colicin import membrane protein